MSQISIFPDRCKFAAIALQNVRADLSPSVTLHDGIMAVTKIPLSLENHWRKWLGAMQSHNLENCNLFLVGIAAADWADGESPIFGGNLDSALMNDVGGTFAFLRMVGAIEYADAFMLAGHVEDGQPEIRHFAQTLHFNITRGSLPWIVREADLQTAVTLSRSYNALLKRFPGQKWRFARGCHALKTALEQNYASDRLHGFVRALEALILPDKGGTENNSYRAVPCLLPQKKQRRRFGRYFRKSTGCVAMLSTSTTGTVP
jgi:hypothetical protein